MKDKFGYLINSEENFNKFFRDILASEEFVNKKFNESKMLEINNFFIKFEGI